jgi:RNA polymerase sigma-70 factor (ECF subfamily)
MNSTGTQVTEQRLLAAARAGDDAAFDALVESRQGDIHAHCYRLLGSAHDADDAVQEVLVRAWRGLPRFDGRSALRTWLYRIATNVCLDAIAKRPRRVLPIDYGSQGSPPGSFEPLDPSHWVEPYPDARVERELGGPEARYEERQSLELAFVAALQHLPPRQRAVFVLRDVLSFTAEEVAEMLGTSTAAVNSALQRARAAIDRRLPEASQQENLRALGPVRLREVVVDIIDAFERGEVEAILAILADDAAFQMPPYAAWYRGRAQLEESWLFPDERPTGLRFLPTRANGQIALGVYKLEPEANRFRAVALEVLALRGELIAEVTSFRDPGPLRAFGLPEELPA